MISDQERQSERHDAESASFWLKLILESPEIPDSVKAELSEENFLEVLRKYLLTEKSR